MHETALMQQLLDHVTRHAARAGAELVTVIRVQVGSFSGVEPRLFESAFSLLAAGTVAEQATLEIDFVPLAAYCDVCANEFAVGDFHFRCPACGSREVHVTKGEELVLASIDVAD
jgi:hydrogenase nickel incorporation protein HypA/HybF